jgi:hypothetical protein
MNDKRMTELLGNVSVRDSVAGLALAPDWGAAIEALAADTSCRAASLSALRVSVEAGSMV